MAMPWNVASVRRCLLFQDWIDSTAEFMKSLDPNHLVTVGCEGFLGSSTPGVPLVTDSAVAQSVTAISLITYSGCALAQAWFHQS